MRVYKPKQHSKQYTGLKYVIYIEMTEITKQQFCVSCLRKKKLSGVASSNNQSMQAHVE